MTTDSRDDKTIVFLTTPTSGTGSIWRVLQTLCPLAYERNTIVDTYYQQGRLNDLKEAVLPETHNLIFFNSPIKFNFDLDCGKYLFILNARDPRDLLCNQYHWEFQHPVPVASEKEVLAAREKVRSAGIDRYCQDRNLKLFYECFYRVVETCPPDEYVFPSYALLCRDFDRFIATVARFLGVTPTAEQLAQIDGERVENLSQNANWVGNQWSGSDLGPGRYARA